MMSFRKGLSGILGGIGQAAQEGAAALKLEAEVAAATAKFNSSWGKLQEHYPTDEVDHAEVRALLKQKVAGTTSKDVATIHAATARLEVILKKPST